MRLVLVLALLAAFLLHLAAPFQPLAELHRTDPALALQLASEIRVPRALLAVGFGAVLGISGAALQALFANPLSSPDVTGTSGGAVFGAVLGAYWLGVTDALLLTAFGAAGALSALLLLLLLAGRQAETSTMLLAGLAIALATGAATSLLLALAPSPFAFYDAFDWLMGSFVDRSLPQAAAALIPAAIACAVMIRRSRALDVMALGEEVAASIGYRPRRVAIEIILLTAIAVGACVSVCGSIGFVGLVAPFIARRMTSGHPGRALIPAALVGGLLLLLADLALRLLPPGRPVPVGVLTTAVGTPLFLWIVVTMRRGLAS